MENIHQGHREKMRQRFLKSGLESFADHEALELLLYYAIPRRDTNPIAHRLMERYGSLTAVLSAPAEDLKKVEGIGESAAVLLKIAGQIGRKARLSDATQSRAMTDVETVGAYLLERYAGETHEVIYELCLDRKGKLLACKRLHDGGAASAALDIRKVVENAILTSASTVILAHNTPAASLCRLMTTAPPRLTPRRRCKPSVSRWQIISSWQITISFPWPRADIFLKRPANECLIFCAECDKLNCGIFGGKMENRSCRNLK